MRPGRPPRFGVALPPGAKAALQQAPSLRRGSPRDRGLDAEHDRMSLAFRKANPFCRFCDQEGRVGLARIMDHILPRREYPELKSDPNNCQGLCHHHDGVKQAMEVHARATGQVDKLAFWCAAIENRPAQFRPLGNNIRE
jgi:hypothetical protein